MSIRFMANASLLFVKNEKNREDGTFKAKVGFNTAPDWVGKTDFYKLCKKNFDGKGRKIKALINEVEAGPGASVKDSELLKLQEENQKLRDQLEATEVKTEKEETIATVTGNTEVKTEKDKKTNNKDPKK